MSELVHLALVILIFSQLGFLKNVVYDSSGPIDLTRVLFKVNLILHLITFVGLLCGSKWGWRMSILLFTFMWVNTTIKLLEDGRNIFKLVWNIKSSVPVLIWLGCFICLLLLFSDKSVAYFGVWKRPKWISAVLGNFSSLKKIFFIIWILTHIAWAFYFIDMMKLDQTMLEASPLSDAKEIEILVGEMLLIGMNFLTAIGIALRKKWGWYLGVLIISILFIQEVLVFGALVKQISDFSWRYMIEREFEEFSFLTFGFLLVWLPTRAFLLDEYLKVMPKWKEAVLSGVILGVLYKYQALLGWFK